MFHSRQEAGILLALKIIQAKLKADLVVGLPRGGVVVANEISQKLGIPLDILMVKKISAPNNQELAIGAISRNYIYIDRDLIDKLNINERFIKAEIKKLKTLLKQREKILRNNDKAINVKNKIVILTDDGAATGATIFASVFSLKKLKVKSIILALPVVYKELVCKLQSVSDLCIILKIPTDFHSVGQFYQDFREVSDKEVVNILRQEDCKIVRR